MRRLQAAAAALVVLRGVQDGELPGGIEAAPPRHQPQDALELLLLVQLDRPQPGARFRAAPDRQQLLPKGIRRARLLHVLPHCL